VLRFSAHVAAAEFSPYFRMTCRAALSSPPRTVWVAVRAVAAGLCQESVVLRKNPQRGKGFRLIRRSFIRRLGPIAHERDRSGSALPRTRPSPAQRVELRLFCGVRVHALATTAISHDL